MSLATTPTDPPTSSLTFRLALAGLSLLASLLLTSGTHAQDAGVVTPISPAEGQAADSEPAPSALPKAQNSGGDPTTSSASRATSAPAAQAAAAAEPTVREARSDDRASYQPMYSKECDAEGAQVPGSAKQMRFGKLRLLSVGGWATFSRLGRHWQFGPGNDGIVGFEASWARFLPHSFWLGWLASSSYDYEVSVWRVAPGAEFGIGPFGVDLSLLLKVNSPESDSPGAQTRMVVSLPPPFYSHPDHARACCPADSDLRSCACYRRILLPVIQFFISNEVWPDGRENKVRWYAGISGKFGYAYHP